MEILWTSFQTLQRIFMKWMHSAVKQGPTTPRQRVAVAPNICWSLVWNLLNVILLAPGLFTWLQDFWKKWALLPQSTVVTEGTIFSSCAMKAQREREKKYSSNLGARWGWVVNATLWPLYLRETDPRTHFIGGWVDPRAGMDGCGKPRPHRYSIPRPTIP